MCNYGVGAEIASVKTVTIVREALNKVKDFDILFIAPLGSMFDNYEVDKKTRNQIFELVAATNCTSFGTETRPEFLKRDSLIDFSQILESKEKRINIGLESADSFILSNCLGKSINLNRLQEQSQMLKELDINLATNILLGAPFLTEYEAIYSTIKSIDWAFKIGVRICILFPSNVKKWTLQSWLYERGFFKAPSLWSLIEVIFQLGPEKTNRIALSYFDKPISDSILDIPYTCQNCYYEVIKTLKLYCKVGDFALIENLRKLNCSCRSRWQMNVDANSDVPVFDRVVTAYEVISKELINPVWWKRNKERIYEDIFKEYEDSWLIKKNK